jgi:uncharacterized protein with von Willebrand factor type A (vWA) domain
MALSELITTKYPKDTLDIVVFGNEHGRLKLKICLTCRLGLITQTRLRELNWQWIFAEKKKSQQTDLYDNRR